MPKSPTTELVVELVRHLAAEHNCRIEIASHDETNPVTASTVDRSQFGFGQTVVEAVTRLRKNPIKSR